MERVVVGSTNPVKVAATDRVVERLTASAESATEGGTVVEPVSVASGVSEQPRGRTETVTGAENRARRALAVDENAGFGVGIEGGVADLDPADGLWLIMWAAVTDGDRIERGGGPTIRLPADVATAVREGAELGPLLDELLGTDGLKHEAGAAGVFTGGAVDRQSSLEHAVAGAFGPFVTDHYE
jgi:inosine/xanthosine triphosphatase